MNCVFVTYSLSGWFSLIKQHADIMNNENNGKQISLCKASVVAGSKVAYILV